MLTFIFIFLRKTIKEYWRLSCWLSSKESACQCMSYGFNPWVGKISWRKKWQPTPVSLTGKSYGWRCLTGYSPWGRKESEQLHFYFTFMSRKTWKEKYELIVEFIDCITSRTGYRCLTCKNCTYVCQNLAWRIIFKSFVNGGINMFLR